MAEGTSPPTQASIHCSRCGLPLAKEGPPFRCANGHEEWFSPKPVAVLVMLIGLRVVLVRRAIPPQIGKLCLPGGFVSRGESFREAAAREFFEETGICVPQVNLVYLWETAVREANVNMVFFLTTWQENRPLPELGGDHESSEVVLANAHELPDDMAFSTHIEAIRRAIGN